MLLQPGVINRGTIALNRNNYTSALRNYATRMETPNNLIAGQLGGTSLIRCKNRVAFSQVKVVLPLFWAYYNGTYVADLNISGNITLACSIEYPKNSGVFYPFLFSGSATKTTTAAAENGLLVSDTLTLPFTINSDTEFGVRTFIQCASTGLFAGGVYTGGASFVEGADYSATTPVDKTQTGTVTNTFTSAYTPIALLTTGTLPCVAVWGDSISFGTGDGTSGSGDGVVGWPARYLYRSGVGIAKFGCPSERMSNADSTKWQRRLRAMGLCNPTHAILQGGTNDIVVGLQTTLAGMQAMNQNIIGLINANAYGVRFIGGTLTPRTTSTDSWATTVNQTAQTNFTPIGASLREQWNDWLRTTPAGYNGYLDAGFYAESALNSGRWAVTGAANYATSDGTHPSQAMATLIGNALPLGLVK